jgi:hypothetical protein
MHIRCPICHHTALAQILGPCRVVAAGKAVVLDLRAYLCIHGHVFFLRGSDLDAGKSLARGAPIRKLGAPHERNLIRR